MKAVIISLIVGLSVYACVTTKTIPNPVTTQCSPSEDIVMIITDEYGSVMILEFKKGEFDLTDEERGYNIWHSQEELNAWFDGIDAELETSEPEDNRLSI